MDARSSTIMNEIRSIFFDGAKPVHFVWKCDFMVDGVRRSPMRTFNIEILRDYSADYAEDIEVEIQVAPSQYAEYIYPNRNNLSVTLYQIPLNEDGTENWEQPRVAEVYRGYLPTAKDLKMNSTREQGVGEDLDLNGAITLKIQLASKALEQIRLHGIGGIYRRVSPGQLLRTLFDSASSRIRVDNSQVIEGVDMVPPDNQIKRDPIVIPHGQMLINAPRYLQDNCGGVYNSDIHFFLQGNHWYIWPKYGTQRVEKTKRVLTIFDIPANQFPGAERTYRETDGQVIIVSTGKSHNHDNGETLDLNLGNGVRFTDPMAILEGMVHAEGGKAVARRGFSNSEFVDTVRKTGMNFAPVALERITANAFKMASKLAPRKGLTMSFTWENANPFLLYPGMPVKVYTLRDNELEERTGVLSYSQYFISPKAKTLRDSQQVCVAALAVFLSRETVASSVPDIPA